MGSKRFTINITYMYIFNLPCCVLYPTDNVKDVCLRCKCIKFTELELCSLLIRKLDDKPICCVRERASERDICCSWIEKWELQSWGKVARVAAAIHLGGRASRYTCTHTRCNQNAPGRELQSHKHIIICARIRRNSFLLCISERV